MHKLRAYLKPECILVPLAAATRDAAIVEMIGVLACNDMLLDVARVTEDVFAREQKMSTGMVEGLAIPHAKSPGAKDLAVAVGIKPEGIDFDSLDGKPAKVLFLVVSQVDRSGPHLQCLAEITSLFTQVAVREQLVNATRAEDVYRLLHEW